MNCRESQCPLYQCVNWGCPGVHEFTDTAPQGVARGIDGGVDVATNAAKILDRLSTHRSESFEPHNFELLCRWHAGGRDTRAETCPPISRQSPNSEVDE